MTEYCQPNGSSPSGLGNDNLSANKITSGNTLIGATASSLTVYLAKFQDNGGIITAYIWNTTGVSQTASNTINSDDLTETLSATTFTFTTPTTISENFFVGVERTGASSGPGVEIKTSNSSQSGWVLAENPLPNTNDTNASVTMCVDASGGGSSGSTFMPPPIAHVRL